MSLSNVARNEGNQFLLESKKIGLAPAVKILRVQKALNMYNRAVKASVNDKERASAYKNIMICSSYLFQCYTKEHDLNQCLFYVKECFSNGNQALDFGKYDMGKNWLQNIQEKLEEISQSTINFVNVNMEPKERCRVLERFCSDLGSKLLNIKTKFYEKIASDYFHMSVVFLEKSDFKGSLNAIAEANMPLLKLEELLHTQDVANFSTLSEFLKSMKDDLYKNKCISQCMQSRFVADLMLNEIIEDPTVNTTFLVVWNVIDLLRESIILTRENDVEQEAVSLSKLAMVYHNILLLKPRAKVIVTQVMQMAKSMQPRNFDKEKWFTDASAIFSQYQSEQRREEEKEKEKFNIQYLKNLKPRLDELKKNSTNSTQKFLSWLYTMNPPKHHLNFSVDIENIKNAPGEKTKKLLSQAIIYYHPDKIDASKYGMEYKLFSEEIVKRLTAKYEMTKGF